MSFTGSAQRRNTPLLVSLYAYINPIIAVVLGTVVLQEPFNARMFLAALVVFLGIAMVRSE